MALEKWNVLETILSDADPKDGMGKCIFSTRMTQESMDTDRVAKGMKS
jgi:hypothetical protein